MTLPKDNPEGYFNSTLSTMYEPFRNKKYMLIHGTGDDNVHYQQSMALARTLELNDVLFKETVSGSNMIYTRRPYYSTTPLSISDLSR